MSERKDVLSGLCFVLTLAAYVRYQARPSFVRYAAVMLLYGLGLMAKPMLVTLPCLLIVLDYWPLRRWRTGGEPTASLQPTDTADSTPGIVGSSAGAQHAHTLSLVLEKLPLLVLAAATSAAAVVFQDKAKAFAPATIHLQTRLANAIVSDAAYLGQMFWPVDLAVFYPYPLAGRPAWQVIVSLVVLVAITLAVVLGRRKWPYLFAGWLWNVGTLVPVIGIIQVGSQARADRYTYLPQIGLYIGLAWAAAALAGSRPRRHAICSIAAGAVVVAIGGSLSSRRLIGATARPCGHTHFTVRQEIAVPTTASVWRSWRRDNLVWPWTSFNSR